MGGRTRQQGCCSSAECSTNFADRADLGRRRLIAVRRVSAVVSLVLCAAAVALLLPAVPAAGAEVADRVAWAAAAFGIPRLLGYARAALSARPVTVPLVAPLVVAVALVAIAVAGWPIVTAVVVAAVLVVDLARRPATVGPTPADPAAAPGAVPGGPAVVAVDRGSG